MGNLFGPWVSHDWINAVLRTVTRASHHTFQFLTKYPIHLAAWNPWLENCWLGMTAPYSHVAYNCWFALTKVKAPVRFICFEPLFEGINRNTLRLLSQTVDWIIIGAQTNPLRLPQRSWVESIQEEADAHKIPVFLKNNLQRLFPGEKLRQELP
jgi:protein gp37